MLHLGSINPDTSSNAERTVTSWAALGRNVVSKLRELILDLYSALVRHSWSDGAPWWKRDRDILERIHQKATEMVKRLEYLSCEDRRES